MPEFEFKKQRFSLKVVSSLVLLIIIVAPFYRANEILNNKSRYPVSPDGLPEGIVSFLNTIDASGRILNSADTGGYLQWMLYPRYKIFIDMKVPLLFTKEDHIVSLNMFKDSTVFEKVIKKYEPSFLSVERKYEDFRIIIRSYPHYMPVFYDSVEVLYVNKQHFPSIAERYKLKDLDPFNTNLDVDRMDADRRARILGEVLRMLSIYPDCKINNYLAGRIYLILGDYQKAIYHAERIISNYPDKYTGFYLKARALKTQGRLDVSVDMYKKVLKKEMFVDVYIKIFEELMEIYTINENYEEAYRAYRVYIRDHYMRGLDNLLSFKGLCYAGLSASKLNKNKEARWLFYMAHLKIPAGDNKHIQMLEDYLKKLEQVPSYLSHDEPVGLMK